MTVSMRLNIACFIYVKTWRFQKRCAYQATFSKGLIKMIIVPLLFSQNTKKPYFCGSFPFKCCFKLGFTLVEKVKSPEICLRPLKSYADPLNL